MSGFPTKRTLRQWAREVMPGGLEILDPDGFDRSDPLMWEREYTLEEYESRVLGCTIAPHPQDGLPHRSFFGLPCKIDHSKTERISGIPSA